MSTVKPDSIADLKGLSCPMPVLKTKKALQALASGQVLQVDLTDAGSKSDLPAMLNRTGDELLAVNENGNVITFLIRKK